jgi:hypothetical protein
VAARIGLVTVEAETLSSALIHLLR